jgi:hypothetical protein
MIIFHNTGGYIVIIWLLLQRVSLKRGHLQVIYMSEITKKGPWIMGGFYKMRSHVYK